MASFMSFLTRRQADRTTSMFGICVFMLKRSPQLFRRNVLAASPGESKPKSCLLACVKAARITNRPLPSVRSHPREADGRTDSVRCFSADCSRRLPSTLLPMATARHFTLSFPNSRAPNRPMKPTTPQPNTFGELATTPLLWLISFSLGPTTSGFYWRKAVRSSSGCTMYRRPPSRWAVQAFYVKPS